MHDFKVQYIHTPASKVSKKQFQMQFYVQTLNEKIEVQQTF